MNIDVSASLIKKFERIEVGEGDDAVNKEIPIKYPLIQIYSATKSGESVCVNIRDFTPYFIVPQPEGFDHNERNFEILKKAINENMKGILLN